jgi:hypothetical protein
MTITGGMGLSNTITTDAGQAVSGGQTLTFATGGATITVGDVTGNDTPGCHSFPQNTMSNQTTFLKH